MISGVESNFASLENSDVHYVRVPSDGPDLLLLHGIGSSWESWIPVMNELRQDFNLIALDWRGHGKSHKPESGYLLANYAAELEAFVIETGLNNSKVMAHSLGGMITMTAIARRSVAFDRVAFEDAPMRVTSAGVPMFDEWLLQLAMPFNALVAYYHETFPVWTMEDCTRRARMFRQTTPAVFREMRDVALQGEIDLIKPMRGTLIPMLQVHGDIESGGIVAPALLEQFVETVPSATTHRIAGAGHNLHRDNSFAFLAAAVPFLLE